MFAPGKKLAARVSGLVSGLIISLACQAADSGRELVELPAPMRQHMLANMRHHLEAVHQIIDLLSQGNSDAAAEIAEQQLGMSSLQKHGAGHMARYMPAPMQALGTELHHAASRFARIAEEGDIRQSWQALPAVTGQCVACHQRYRLQ